MLAEVTHLEIAFAVGVIAFVLGVAFATKVTDLFKGIPGDLRTALNGVEKATIVNVKIAQASVIATLPQPVVKVAASSPLPAPVFKSASASGPAPAAAPVVVVEVPTVATGAAGAIVAAGLQGATGHGGVMSTDN